MSGKSIDYLELIARASEEDRAEREQSVLLPEPVGEQVVDYMAISQAWKEERGWMDNRDLKKRSKG